MKFLRAAICLISTSILLVASASAQDKVAFVTSETGSGDLSTWADSNGLDGTAGADKVCQNLAADAGLSNAANFVAWVSSSTDDAYCRANGLGGKVVDNCGEDNLPNNAGPWRRTDGLPFLPDIATAINDGVAFYPPDRDENGAQLPAGSIFMHASDDQGQFIPANSCSDYSNGVPNSGLFIWGGRVTATTSSWAGKMFGPNCDQQSHLLCLETGSIGSPIAAEPVEARVAFISSSRQIGQLIGQPGVIGQAGGDAICQSLAADATLEQPESFVAWLSDSTGDAIDKLTNEGPWKRVDEVLIAESSGDFASGRLLAPINVTEAGDYIKFDIDDLVWTGTQSNGMATISHCNNWTNNQPSGMPGTRGIPVDSGLWWTDRFTSICPTPLRLYCLSNAEMPRRKVFTTSATGNADFSSWAEAAPGLDGLDAADSICQAQAASGGLGNPDNFIAWMSDATNDAYCRVHGLGGKRSSNCGLGALPSDAGPWDRTDGIPAAKLPDVPSDDVEIITSSQFDQDGNELGPEQIVWSSSNRKGQQIGVNTCNDWQSSAGLGQAAPLSFNGWDSWINEHPCFDTNVHLRCVEKVAGADLVFPQHAPSNIAFLTPDGGNGDLGSWPMAEPGTSGIEAGDSICNAYAEQAGLPWVGQYKAWLSDDGVDARDRFEYEGVRRRPDGIILTDNLEQISTSKLSTANMVSSNGDYLPGVGVWSGSNADGTVAANHCSNWTSTSGQGRGGRANHSDQVWTDFQNVNCNNGTFRLHCISDADDENVFLDGFEEVLE